MRLLVLQHTPWEKPGTLLVDAAKKYKVNLKILRVWQEAFPSLDIFDGVIALGGKPNVDQEKEYPFLVEEKATIREAIDLDLPFLGFCLGHQLLADALGATVGPNFSPSIGVIKGHLTRKGREHPLFKHLPRVLPLFKWHGQAVRQPLPKEVEVLMTSEDCPVEAISVKGRPHLVGVQFDNHAATTANIATWLHRDRRWLESLGGRHLEPSAMLNEVQENGILFAEEFDRFFKNYLELIR